MKADTLHLPGVETHSGAGVERWYAHLDPELQSTYNGFEGAVAAVEEGAYLSDEALSGIVSGYLDFADRLGILSTADEALAFIRSPHTNKDKVATDEASGEIGVLEAHPSAYGLLIDTLAEECDARGIDMLDEDKDADLKQELEVTVNTYFAQFSQRLSAELAEQRHGDHLFARAFASLADTPADELRNVVVSTAKSDVRTTTEKLEEQAAMYMDGSRQTHKGRRQFNRAAAGLLEGYPSVADEAYMADFAHAKLTEVIGATLIENGKRAYGEKPVVIDNVHDAASDDMPTTMPDWPLDKARLEFERFKWIVFNDSDSRVRTLLDQLQDEGTRRVPTRKFEAMRIGLGPVPEFSLVFKNTVMAAERQRALAHSASS